MRRAHVSLCAATAALLLLAGVAAFGAAPAAASHAEDSTNYTVILPEKSDHLPGDQNPENASIIHRAAGGNAFVDVAPNGFETFDRLEIRSDEVDFSACDSPNTAVFGVDRGNNNTGTQVDTDLLNHMKESRFEEDGIEVIFYEESDFGGDPTYLNPEDAIVAVQGAGSSAGPCYTMPTDPGWYQITGTIEGTTENGEKVTITEESHYFPICEGCHDEETAREKLGPRPSEDDTSDDTSGDADTPTPTSTPTPTPTATPTPEDGASDGTTETTTTTETGTPTETIAPADDGSDGDDGDDGSESGDESSGQQNDDVGGTPTPGDGPGFGAVVGLLALLASGLFARRR